MYYVKVLTHGINSLCGYLCIRTDPGTGEPFPMCANWSHAQDFGTEDEAQRAAQNYRDRYEMAGEAFDAMYWFDIFRCPNS